MQTPRCICYLVPTFLFTPFYLLYVLCLTCRFVYARTDGAAGDWLVGDTDGKFIYVCVVSCKKKVESCARPVIFPSSSFAQFCSFVCHEPTTSQQRSPCKFSFRFVRALFLLFPFFFNLVTHMGRNRKRLYLTPKEKGEIGRGREMLFGEGLHYTISTTLQEHDQEVWRWAAHK